MFASLGAHLPNRSLQCMYESSLKARIHVPNMQPRALQLADGTAVCMTAELLTALSAGCPRCLTSHVLRI